MCVITFAPCEAVLSYALMKNAGIGHFYSHLAI